MKHQHGFTLIELSIVLVIIGLIVGGVLVGQSLIRSAQLNSLISQRGEIQAAMNTFRLKYNCLPGDCINAAAFGLGASGNGNKLIEGAFFSSNESYRMWTHLGAAGLIAGTYTGVTGAGGPGDAIVGENILGSKISKVGFYYTYVDDTRIVHFNSPARAHVMMVGYDTPSGNATELNYGGFIKVEELLSMDRKHDDGVANTGSIRTWVAYGGHDTDLCNTGGSPNFTYNTSSLSSLCNLVFPFEP